MTDYNSREPIEGRRMYDSQVRNSTKTRGSSQCTHQARDYDRGGSSYREASYSSSNSSGRTPRETSRQRVSPHGFYEQSPYGGSAQRHQGPSSRGGLFKRGIFAIGRFLGIFLAFIGRATVTFILFCGRSLTRGAFGKVVICLVLLLAICFGVDYFYSKDKVYSGVFVGEIDASGLTVSELEELIDEVYGSLISGGSVVVYVSEEAEALVDDSTLSTQSASQAEQISVEEAQASKLAWVVDAESLGATVPSEELAIEAYEVGREEGDFLTRIYTFFDGFSVDVTVDYSEDLLEDLLDDINATVGDDQLDWNIEVIEGVAYVTEGYSGYLVDSETFVNQLTEVFLNTIDDVGSFVVTTEAASVRISEESAQTTADLVNEAIANGVEFLYEDSSWFASAEELGSWIVTSVEEVEGEFCLSVSIDPDLAKSSLLLSLQSSVSNEGVSVTFDVVDDEIFVSISGMQSLPSTDEAIEELNLILFGQESYTSSGSVIEISVDSIEAPETMTFDEALEYGVISVISTYSTEYSTASGTENRNSNIQLASDLATNSIIEAGSTWSFNDTVGERSEENGFLAAGGIINGVYTTDDIGGGICQVATTIFNAAYEAGFSVLTRYNHSLYISSYPLGLDAAVAWGYLDLVWRNDSSSDVLMQVTCDSGVNTTTLYGVDPGYQVTSVMSSVTEGASYTTSYEIDETLEPGTSYVSTVGVDGCSLSVTRTVTDADGTVLKEDVFYSSYDPTNEVIVMGPEL